MFSADRVQCLALLIHTSTDSWYNSQQLVQSLEIRVQHTHTHTKYKNKKNIMNTLWIMLVNDGYGQNYRRETIRNYSVSRGIIFRENWNKNIQSLHTEWGRFGMLLPLNFFPRNNLHPRQWFRCYIKATISVFIMKWRHRIYGHDTIAFLRV